MWVRQNGRCGFILPGPSKQIRHLMSGALSGSGLRVIARTCLDVELEISGMLAHEHAARAGARNGVRVQSPSCFSGRTKSPPEHRSGLGLLAGVDVVEQVDDIECIDFAVVVVVSVGAGV